MLQHGRTERRELYRDARRQISGREREIGAPEPRRAAERRGYIPDRHEMAHLIDGDVENDPAPARDRLGLGTAQPLRLAIPETEGGIEVDAHQLLLEIGGFVERVQQLLEAYDFQ